MRAPTLLWKSENVIRTHFVALGGFALVVVCSAGLGIKSDDESGGDFYWAVAPPQKRLNVSTMTVDGEVFEVWTPVGYPNQRNFDWLSGPNEGYGFSSSGPMPTSGPVPWTKADLEREIRDFLALVDPTTGYIED